MTRKIASLALAVTGLVIFLGAFGHSFMGRRALDIGVAPEAFWSLFVVLGALALILSLTLALLGPVPGKALERG